MTKLIKKLVGRSKIVCKTGLHIGGSSDSTEIGGLDNPVIRRASDGKPYIPGSSLKGKMRCLLQQVHGQLEFYDAVEEKPAEKIEIEGEPKLKKPTVAMLFGSGVDKSKGEKDRGYASKIIFRDAHLTEASIKKLEASAYTVMPYTELKQENTIDRVTGVTVDGGIRTMERVPAESEFEFEVVINIYEKEHVKPYLELFHMGVRLLEHDYLGGSGSRGYGHIAFKDFNWEVIDMTTIQQQSIPTTWKTQIISKPD